MTHEEFIKKYGGYSRNDFGLSGDGKIVYTSVDFAVQAVNQIESSLSTQLTEMTAEKNKWFDRYVQSDARADILDGELRITQKKMEVLASMLDKGTNPSVL